MILDGECVSFDDLFAVLGVGVDVDLQRSECAILQGSESNILLKGVSEAQNSLKA